MVWAMAADHEYSVDLTGVINAQITISFSGVNDAAGSSNTIGASMERGELPSDFNLDGSVNSGDALTARARSGTSIP